MANVQHHARSLGPQLLALAPAALLPCLASLVYFVWCSESHWVQSVYGATKLFTLLWPLFAVVVILREPLPRPRFGTHHLRAIPAGVAVGLVIAAAILYLAAAPLAPLLAASRPQIISKVSAIGIGEHFVLFALVLSVGHSLLEEYAWRWFVFGQFTRVVPAFLAHVLAGIAFAAHHVVITSQFFGLVWGFVMGAAVGVGGMVFSWLYQRQRTLVGAWIVHIFADLAIMSTGRYVLVGSWW